MQVTNVTKALGSVGKICEAGNRIVFEPKGGYIENIETGGRTPLHKEGVVYKLRTWTKIFFRVDVVEHNQVRFLLEHHLRLFISLIEWASIENFSN